MYKELGMICNTKKTKCKILNLLIKLRFSQSCPHFTTDGHCVQFINEFCYLGHIISNNLCDDADIKRKIKIMYVPTNMLLQRFRKCSQHVKIAIFRAYCICLYGVALWSRFSSCIMTKFKYCYNKCMKKFLGYTKYYSATEILLTLCLPSFDTVIHNYKKSFLCVWSKHSNDLVKLLWCVYPCAFLWALLCCIVHLVLHFFSKRELKFMFAICHRPSVCLSSVCLSVCRL